VTKPPFHDDPVGFVESALGAMPHPWQRELLEAVRDHPRVAVRSGNGPGKSTTIAWTILWFLMTRTPAKVVVTAAKETQLRDVVWAEMGLWLRKPPQRLIDLFELQADKITRVDEPDCFAIARVARKESPEAFQGFHSENILLIAEEASGVDDAIFEAGIGVMSTPGAKTLLAGNPTRTSGFFFDAFHKARHRWHRLHWNCEEINRTHPGQISPDLIEEVVSRYGRDSNPYRYRVLGEFPTSEEDAVIPLNLIEEATRRDVKPWDGVEAVWGLDVARFGDDRTALCKRLGNTLVEPPKWWRHKDGVQVAGLVFQEYMETPAELRPHAIMTDVIGVGASAVDQMRVLNLPVRAINVSESPAIRERYNRLRDEIWFAGREWFQARNVKIPEPGGGQDDPMELLISELSQPKYKTTPGGKLQVESKDELKKRGLASPDLADAFILTLASPELRTELTLETLKRTRYGKRADQYAGSTWMAA